MSSTKSSQQPYYTQLPSDNPHYILLPYHPRHPHPYKPYLITLTSLLLISLLLFFLYPSDPHINIARLQLNHIHPHLSPTPSLDISLALTIKVRNRDFFSFDYDSLVVSIGYRGRQLGFVKSDQGFLRARASSYVNATLVLDGIRVMSDVVYLIEDLCKGRIPFDTVTEVKGKVGLLFFDVPIKSKVSCEVSVDTANQTIVRQDCYPE
ncbi:hypothetical protein ACHQM5_002257 [Ranunculus cassubicifolius]